MNAEPDHRELAKQIAVREDCLNASFERLRADRTGMKEEDAKRETRLIGVMIGLFAVGTTILAMVMNVPA